MFDHIWIALVLGAILYWVGILREISPLGSQRWRTLSLANWTLGIMIIVCGILPLIISLQETGSLSRYVEIAKIIPWPFFIGGGLLSYLIHLALIKKNEMEEP